MSRKLVDAWFGAFRTKDISVLERALAEDFVHVSPFGEIGSKEAYLKLVRENEEAFFSPVIEILDVIEDDDKFAVRYLVNQNPACDCIYVQDGQISKIYSYYHVGKRPTMYDDWQS
ncbi:MAG: nuclear transport factor 2 family protein [Candidatus Promineifilaceae bacterium]